MEENSGGTAANLVRKGGRHPYRWGSNREAELEAETSEKKEKFAHQKLQAREMTRMQVLFNIPGPLREFTENRSAVRVEVKAGANLLQALQALCAAYPGLRDRVLTEGGETRRHVNIFVASENVRYTGGLAATIPAGAEISIVPAISGG